MKNLLKKKTNEMFKVRRQRKTSTKMNTQTSKKKSQSRRAESDGAKTGCTEKYIFTVRQNKFKVLYKRFFILLTGVVL